MSTYFQITKHPATGKFEPAVWIDDFYAHHEYGVRFNDGRTYRPQGLETKKTEDYTGQERLDIDDAFKAYCNKNSASTDETDELKKLVLDTKNQMQERITDAAHCSSFMQALKFFLWDYARKQGNKEIPPENELDNICMNLWDRFNKK